MSSAENRLIEVEIELKQHLANYKELCDECDVDFSYRANDFGVRG
jgi:hypothetical protein